MLLKREVLSFPVLLNHGHCSKLESGVFLHSKIYLGVDLEA